MKRRRWLIVVAVVALLVALGYFAASRPSRLESGFRQIVQKYGMESTDPGGGHYIGEGFSDEKCRKLEQDLARLAEETGLVQGEA